MTHPLMNIVSKALNVNNHVDKKKLMLFFNNNRDNDKVLQLEELLPLIKPGDITIVNGDNTYEDPNDSPAAKFVEAVKIILPNCKVRLVKGVWVGGELQANIKENEVSQLDLQAPSLGIRVGLMGCFTIYRSSHSMSGVSFKGGDLTTEQIQEIADTDLDQKYPTEGMVLPQELAKSDTNQITLWINHQHKELDLHNFSAMKAVMTAFWNLRPQVDIHIKHFKDSYWTSKSIIDNENVEGSQYLLISDGRTVSVQPVVDGKIGKLMGSLYL